MFKSACAPFLTITSHKHKVMNFSTGITVNAQICSVQSGFRLRILSRKRGYLKIVSIKVREDKGDIEESMGQVEFYILGLVIYT